MQTLFWSVGIIATFSLATVDISAERPASALKMTAAGAFLAIGFSGTIRIHNSS